MPAAGAGAVTVIVPVTSLQVAGSAVVTVGAAGAVGAPLIVATVAVEIHPAAFFTVTLYVPGVTPVNILLVFV
jgi:hypothetical protein